MKDILAAIKTIEDRNRIYAEIELVSTAMYKGDELEKVLDSQISKSLREYIGNETSETLSRKLSELKSSLDQASIVKLTLAFEPSAPTIDKIIGFVRENLSEKTVLEILYEPKILGGAILEFNGLYRDYTLKSKLEEVFKNKREQIFDF